MNALVLGGNGFIGSALVDKLIEEGHYVTVFDRLNEKFRKPKLNVKYIYSSFSNRPQIAEALQGTDIVFHLISTTDPKSSMIDPKSDVESNVIETIFLLEECVKRKIQKFIFVSSGGTVYGIPHELPIKESAAMNPICSYGITKLAIEKYIVMYNYVYGLQYSILRPSNAFGYRQDPLGNVGAITHFLNNILEKKKITIWGDGSTVRDFIFIKDLVEGIYKASVFNKSDIFNLGSGSGITINTLIELIQEVVNKEVLVEYQPSRKYDVPEISLDISKASEFLGWTPATPLRKGIELTWNFLKSIK